MAVHMLWMHVRISNNKNLASFYLISFGQQEEMEMEEERDRKWWGIPPHGQNALPHFQRKQASTCLVTSAFPKKDQKHRLGHSSSFPGRKENVCLFI